jgi:hypothetical protein
MKYTISGHRLHKLQAYDIEWIKAALDNLILDLSKTQHIIGYSGMASGVDLWFCESLMRKYLCQN